MNDFVHHTVLLAEAVRLLKPEPGKVFVDGTLGGGGHTEALLQQGAMVVGIDRDPQALNAAKFRLRRFDKTFSAVMGTFDQIASLVPQLVDGVLVDLGVSSPQIDHAERGFSFQHDGPLDMRMGDQGPTASEFIAQTREEDLANFIWNLAEEKFSRQIARELKKRLPQTTFEAVECVKSAVPRRAWPEKINVATRTFQALRMAVNDELGQLERFLADIPKILKPHGIAAAITFHSLEDRMVKQAFRALCEGEKLPPKLPVIGTHMRGDFTDLTRKPITASEEELALNPRSRSAKLRAVEKRI